MNAHAGERGVIPGSMGSPSFHVVGRGCPAALCSSSHGAGRALSRSEARRRIGRERLLEQTAAVWFDRKARA
ncbi:MAG TPA: RtcB family protein [Polyangiales bacterium]|nr:RtcB family protein [Polyangiales bacterium]